MDYKTRITPAKEAAVKALKDEFGQYDGYIFTDFRGMTVDQITTIRKNLMKQQGNYRVVKNRYAQIALKQLGHDACKEQLQGPTGVALLKGDTTNSTAKELFASKDAGTTIVVKGALVNDQFLSAEQLLAYSKLPTRDELLSILMGTMKAPVQKLAATLLSYVKKMGEGGEAKPAVDAAPAAEPAPAAPAQN